MNITKYLSNLKLSTSSVNYYIEALSKPLRSSFFFFIISMLVIGIIRGVDTALTDVPYLKNEVEIALDELNENFDENLEITWADNQLEMNRDNLTIYWPSRFDHQYYNLPSNLAIIDNSEASPGESEFLNNNNTITLINKNSIYVLNELEKKDWAEYPLNTFFGEINSHSINKQNLPKIISGIKETMNSSFGKIQLAAGIFTIANFIISKLWFLITQSVLVYLLFKIYTLNFNFKKVLKLNLNILVPAEIIGVTSSIFYRNLDFSMSLVAFWVILTFISLSLTKIKRVK